MKRANKEYLRSAVFGIEDSLVSTTGLIAGLSVGAERRVVILGATTAVLVAAVSIGAGEYLSDEAIQELDKIKRHRDEPLKSGLLMFGVYLGAGFVPLAPVLLLEYPVSLYFSITLALCGLFLLGWAKGRLVKIPPPKSALKILVIGGLATALGIIVGLVFKI